MITITVAASKGGNAKSTLCASLAAFLDDPTSRVVIIDLDPAQESLTVWKHVRGEGKGPAIVAPKALGRDLRRLDIQGHAYAIVDTPPAVDGVTEAAIQHAGYVLIPCRQSLFDLIGVEGVVQLCRQHEKPFGFVMTDVSPDWKATNTNSAKALGELGHVFKTRLTHRESYVTALAAGKAPWEVDKVARAEIEALWGEIKKWMK